jgi:hypothetical protein
VGSSQSAVWEKPIGTVEKVVGAEGSPEACGHTSVDDNLVADLQRTAKAGHGRVVVCGTKQSGAATEVALGRIGRTPNFMWRNNTMNSVCIVEFEDGKPRISSIPGWSVSDWMSRRVEELLMKI